VSVDLRGDCPNCGAELAADAWFCQRCGSPAPHPWDMEEPDPPSWGAFPEVPPAVRLWGPRVAAAALILLAAAAVVFALLVLLFGVFVES